MHVQSAEESLDFELFVLLIDAELRARAPLVSLAHTPRRAVWTTGRARVEVRPLCRRTCAILVVRDGLPTPPQIRFRTDDEAPFVARDVAALLR